MSHIELDWRKLKTLDNSTSRTFEELCFQIIKQKYSNSGNILTPLDGQGGDGGVEFYMTLPNGDEWGWQCKFFCPNPRLNYGNRKEQIKRSVAQAVKSRPHLKKIWICTPSNFTPQEDQWFKDTLPRSKSNGKVIIPLRRNLELMHFSAGDIFSCLLKPEFIGIKEFFFGEIELSLAWFRYQFQRQLAKVGDKYDPLLHTETHIEEEIHNSLGDRKSAEEITRQMQLLAESHKKVEQGRDALASNNSVIDVWREIKNELLKDLDSGINHLNQTFNQLSELSALPALTKHEELRTLSSAIEGSLAPVNKIHSNFYNMYDSKLRSSTSNADSTKDIIKICYDTYEGISNATQIITYITRLRNALTNQVLNIFGDAGFGKTHLSCHICDEHLQQSSPALLFLGRAFSSDKNIEEVILRELSLTCSWQVFIQSLVVAAKVYDAPEK